MLRTSSKWLKGTVPKPARLFMRAAARSTMPSASNLGFIAPAVRPIQALRHSVEPLAILTLGSRPCSPMNGLATLSSAFSPTSQLRFLMLLVHLVLARSVTSM